MECSFVPIDLDQGTEGDNVPDFMMQEMTEEDRKRWKKKNRKKRSQMRKKLQRETNKTSSDSGTQPNLNGKEVKFEGSSMETSTLEKTEQVGTLNYYFSFTKFITCNFFRIVKIE